MKFQNFQHTNGYNSIYDNKASSDCEDEMEAYYRKRSRDEDPMNQFWLIVILLGTWSKHS